MEHAHLDARLGAKKLPQRNPKACPLPRIRRPRCDMVRFELDKHLGLPGAWLEYKSGCPKVNGHARHIERINPASNASPFRIFSGVVVSASQGTPSPATDRVCLKIPPTPHNPQNRAQIRTIQHLSTPTPLDTPREPPILRKTTPSTTHSTSSQPKNAIFSVASYKIVAGCTISTARPYFTPCQYHSCVIIRMSKA